MASGLTGDPIGISPTYAVISNYPFSGLCTVQRLCDSGTQFTQRALSGAQSQHDFAVLLATNSAEAEGVTFDPDTDNSPLW